MTDQPRILMVDDDQEIGALVADATVLVTLPPTKGKVPIANRGGWSASGVAERSVFSYWL